MLSFWVCFWEFFFHVGLEVNLSQLEGVAVKDMESAPPSIWYFPEEALPESLPERIGVLFETKSKWSQDDIMPYIQNVSVSAQSATTLLTKYSRVHTVRGVKYYSSKHTK